MKTYRDQLSQQERKEYEEIIRKVMLYGDALEQLLEGEGCKNPQTVLAGIDKGIQRFYDNYRRVKKGEDFKRLIAEKFNDMPVAERYKAYLGSLMAITNEFARNVYPLDTESETFQQLEEILKQDVVPKLDQYGGSDAEFNKQVDENLVIMEQLLEAYSRQTGFLMVGRTQSRELMKKIGSVEPEEVEKCVQQLIDNEQKMAVAIYIMQLRNNKDDVFAYGEETVAECAGANAAAQAEAMAAIQLESCQEAGEIIGRIGTALIQCLVIGLFLATAATAYAALITVIYGTISLFLSELILAAVLCALGWGVLVIGVNKLDKLDMDLYEWFEQKGKAFVASVYEKYYAVAEWIEDNALPKIRVLIQSIKNFVRERILGLKSDDADSHKLSEQDNQKNKQETNDPEKEKGHYASPVPTTPGYSQ